MSCYKCKVNLEKPADTLTCSACKKSYHKECFGVDVSTLSNLTRSGLKQLKCSICMNPDSLAVVPSDLESYGDYFRSIIKSELEAALKPIVTAVEQTNAKTTEYMTKLDKIEVEVSQVRRDFESLSTINTATKDQIATLSQEVHKLQANLYELEQYSRNCNIELSGIPEDASENLSDIVQKVAEVIGFDKPLNLAKIHRVPSRVDRKIKPIICQFNQRSDRDEFIRLARGKRDLDIKSLNDSFVNSKFYVNDHLTQRNKLLLFKAKQFRNDHPEFKFVWCRGGKIFMRKNENSKVIRILTENDFDKLNG